MKMTRTNKLILLVACGVLIVAISAVAIAQGLQPPPAQQGFPGSGYGMPMMPSGPGQPVMQVHGDHLFILMGNILYKIDMDSMEQIGVLRLVPPPPVHPFGGPGAQPPNQPQ